MTGEMVGLCEEKEGGIQMKRKGKKGTGCCCFCFFLEIQAVEQYKIQNTQNVQKYIIYTQAGKKM